MRMPGLDCSPNDPVGTNFANFANFWQNIQQASVGLFRASFLGIISAGNLKKIWQHWPPQIILSRCF